MSKQAKYDWRPIVNCNPEGYIEMRINDCCLHGQIEKIKINDDDDVVITTKWQVKVNLNLAGLPEGEWERVLENKPISFPNLVAPYFLEDTPGKGERVRYGSNLIYLKCPSQLDLSKIVGMEEFASQATST